MIYSSVPRTAGEPRPPGGNSPPAKVTRTRRFVVVAIVVISADQTTKYLTHLTAETALTQPVHNPELALGIIGGRPSQLVLAMIAALIVFGAHLAIRMNQRRIPPTLAALLLGGAIGNLIDRVAFGAVRDFFPTPWAVINLADIALILGALGYVLFITAKGRHTDTAGALHARAATPEGRVIAPN